MNPMGSRRLGAARKVPPLFASISLQPSSISEARASRSSFSTGYSRVTPLPPNIWMASEATSNAVCVPVTLAAMDPCRAPSGIVWLKNITRRDIARATSTLRNMWKRR